MAESRGAVAAAPETADLAKSSGGVAADVLQQYVAGLETDLEVWLSVPMTRFNDWLELKHNAFEVLRSDVHVPCSWRDHNAALKWTRDRCEQSGLVDKEFNLGEVVQVPKL